MPQPSLTDILAAPQRTPLTVGRETATELGLAALEHLEGAPTPAELQALLAYALRHDDSAPVRDALIAVLFNASGTLTRDVVEGSRAAYQVLTGGAGDEARAAADTDPAAVPRRQALAERLLAERARRLRPRMHAVVAAILGAAPGEVPGVPRCFLERNWIDLRDALTQRARHEPMHREAIARWVAAQPAPVRAWLHQIEDALVDVTIHEILQAPERAPREPYCGAERVAEAVRSAIAFRGEYARMRLERYLERLVPGSAWHATIAAIAAPAGATRDGSTRPR